MSEGSDPHAVPEKSCPVCGTSAPVYDLSCIVCGHEWFPGAAAPRRRSRAIRLWVALAVALGGLLLSLCVLFGLVHSYVRR